MGRLICVTGSGTDVGKSFASAVLVKLLTRKGARTAYYKPYQSGVYENGGVVILPDIDFIRRVTPLAAKDIHAGYALRAPMAPYHAAIEQNAKIGIDDALRKAERLKDEYDFVVVEGAGGLYVPILENYFFIDFFKKLEGEMLLVSDIGLGTLNHTLLSFRIMYQENMRLRAVLLSRTDEAEEPVHAHNEEYLRNAVSPLSFYTIPFLRAEDFSDERFPYEHFDGLLKGMQIY